MGEWQGKLGSLAFTAVHAQGRVNRHASLLIRPAPDVSDTTARLACLVRAVGQPHAVLACCLQHYDAIGIDGIAEVEAAGGEDGLAWEGVGRAGMGPSLRG